MVEKSYLERKHHKKSPMNEWYLDKGNSSLPLFKSHKAVERKQKGSTSAIRGLQRNNRNTEVQQKNKRQCNVFRNEILDNNCHIHDLYRTW